MGGGIELRTDYSGDDLRGLAKRSNNANQTRRLLTLASIYDGGSRTGAARIGGVGLQIIRDWVMRFNGAGPDGLINRKAPGGRPSLNPDQRLALAKAVEDGPRPYIDGVVRWRLKDLAWWVHEEFGVSMSEAAMSRTLKRLGFVKLTARPQHHGQNTEELEAFKKSSPYVWMRSDKTSQRVRIWKSGSPMRRA
jgi:transposase